MTAPRILSPEEFRRARQGDDPKPKVTVGPLQPVGIPADEMARIASGEMGLGNSIAARLQLAHETDDKAEAVLEDANKRTAPGLASTAANVFLSNVAAPFSEKMAEAGTEGALGRFAQGGGDPGQHANLLGALAAGGAVGGNVALAKATPPISTKGMSAGKAVALRAAEGAGQNAAVSLAGSAMDEDSLPDAAKKALLNAGAGAVFGGLVEGMPRIGELRAGLAPEPKPPVAEQVRSEILSKLDPRDRQFAMTDPQFGRAFNPEGKPHVMSPEEFQQARAARDAEQATDIQALRQGVDERQGREVRFPVERTSAAKNAEPMLNLKNRAGKVDLSPSRAGSEAPRNPQVDTPEFKAWFGGSKLVDPEGQPVRVYHGTNASFDVFDRAMSGKGPSKLGFWFTDSPDFAENFGDVLMPAYLALRNPKRLTQEQWGRLREAHGGDAAFFAKMRDDLMAQGYDGIIVPGGMTKLGKMEVRDPGVMAVFEPTQVKSATGNSGAFDSRNPRITGSIAPEVGQALASAGVGAAVGASQNEDDRMTGAIMGGAAGLAAFGGMKRGGKLGLSTEDVSPKFPRQEPQGTPYKAPIDDGADPRLFNLKKYGFSPEGEQIFRDIVGKLDLSKKRVGWDETMAEAHRRSTDPDALIRLKGQWDGADAVAARAFVAQSTERIGLLAKQIRQGGVTPDEATAMRAEIERLTDDIGIMAGRSAKERSAAGRNLNAYRIVARNAMDTPTWQELAQRAKGLPLDSDELLQIRELTRTLNREGLVQFVAGLHKSSPWEKAMALWKAGLLTSPVTHTVNNASNATMLAMETAKEPVAVAADHLISLIRGTERTKAMSARGLVRDPLMAGGASLRAATKAVKEQGVLGALRQNMTQEMIGKWDFRQTNFDSPVLQAYTDVVFGSLSAEDRLWRNMAFARSIEEQVKLAAPKLAKAEGISISDALKKLRQSPPEELKVKAMGDAEIAVFQNTNALAEGFRRFKSGVRDVAGPKAEAVADFVAPFVRTPTNVALRLVDYSPLGAVKLWKALKPELSSAEQKAVAEQVGRVATGTGLVWLGFALAADGKATGAAPKEPSGRAQFDLEGKQANSVRMGDSWVNVSRLSPAGMLVAVGAQMYHIAASAESKEGAVAGALYAPARVALDQSFLKGVSGVLDAANDPTRFGERFVEQTAGSIVPAGVAAIARATDKTVRKPEGVAQTVASRIPGLSRAVPAKRDAFGQPIERVASAPEAMLSPLPRTKSKDSDPVVAELARLGVAVSMPSRTLSPGKGQKRVKLEQGDYDALLQEMGFAFKHRLKREIASAEYQSLTDEERAETLGRVLSRARTQMYARQRERLNGARMVGDESPP